MKGVKELLLDDSPKNAKKLEKLLAKDAESASYLEACRAEAGSATAREFPKLNLLLTDSYLCSLRMGFAGGIRIVPVANITSIYRTNIIATEYDFDQFTLAVETTTGIKYMCTMPRTGAKSLDVFKEVVDAVKAKINGGAQL